MGREGRKGEVREGKGEGEGEGCVMAFWGD